MIATEKLHQPAVQAFIDSLNARDERAFADAVIANFVYTCGQDKGDAADFYTSHTQFVVTEQSRDGRTLTGVMIRSGEPTAARWKFEPRFKDVVELDIDATVELSDDVFAAAMGQFDFGANRSTPAGSLRRMTLGDDHYVHSWGRGALGRYDWINTGEKANGPVYRSYHSPADGDQSDEVRISKVYSRLSVDLGWEDTHQKATVRFNATLKYWDAVAWLDERMRLADETVPVIKGTLTLTAPPTLTVPDGKIISSEGITLRGHRPPYALDLTREYSLAGLTPGTYTLTLTDAVKTGGYWTTKYNTTVKLKDHTLTFPIGD
ncbi:hypothetical protein ACFWBC_32565 [Streptomyces sp. NPDC059985]|uniref:hypothetical protein n=1 Tax=Streptomyces sp. NPDC059985 TaxID=3347025 RepID=UPI003680E176